MVWLRILEQSVGNTQTAKVAAKNNDSFSHDGESTYEGKYVSSQETLDV